jgi:hypothetical protein
MNTIQAINSKYQKAVNKAYKALREYYRLVDLDDDYALYSNALSRHLVKQEKQYDIYETVWPELPKQEEKNFIKQHLALHGY